VWSIFLACNPNGRAVYFCEASPFFERTLGSSQDEDRIAKLIVQPEPLCVAEGQRIAGKSGAGDGQATENWPSKEEKQKGTPKIIRRN